MRRLYNMNQNTIIYVLTLFSVTTLFFKFQQEAYAQPRFQGGINFALGFPQEEFERNVDNTGFGIGLDFTVAPSLSPVSFGGSFGFLIYGSETRQEPFSTTIPDVTVEVETQNSILQGHLLMRLQPNSGFVRPYIDGLLGFNYLFTQTEIKDDSFGEEIASSTNFDDFAFSYGAGGGFMIRVYDGPAHKGLIPAKVPTVLIDLRIRYLKGGEAEYLKEGSIGREAGRVFYDVSKSETDLITSHIGVVLEF